VVGRIAAFLAADCEIFLLDVSQSYTKRLKNIYPLSKVQFLDSFYDPFYLNKSTISRYIWEVLRNLSLVSEDHKLSIHLRNIISKIKPKIAVTHYGPIAIHYARILKRIAPNLPIIDIINLLPSSFNPRTGLYKLLRGWWGKLEDLNYRRWLRNVEGIIYASEAMCEFANKKFQVQKNISCVMPDYLPSSFQGKNSVDKAPKFNRNDANPSVVFLGAPDRYGVSIDNLDKQFIELAKEHIHVHSGTLPQEVISTGYGHQYKKFTDVEVLNGLLAEYAFQFDAALVTYNIDKRHERFRTTYPTRFFTALTTGIPIAIRAGFFDVCEQFVTKNEIGFIYFSPSDLRLKLLDKQLLAKYRANAQKKKRIMNAEMQGYVLQKFINKVISCKNEKIDKFHTEFFLNLIING